MSQGILVESCKLIAIIGPTAVTYVTIVDLGHCF